MKYLLLYLLIINAVAFTLMHIDKQKAKKRQWRIPEATLLGFAALGGSIGAWIGMQVFRHKTKHIQFALGIPVIFGVQLLLAIGLWYFLR